MKNIQSIISNITKQSQFKPLNRFKIINKLIATLPYNLRKSALYSSIKGEMLLIAFNHPTSVSEFNNYKQKIMLDILEQLKILYKDTKYFDEIKDIKTIKAYLPRNILNNFDMPGMENITENAMIEYYKERANGSFYISKDSPFYNHFKEIQSIIKNNQ
ncbi:hypothetical protein CCY99_05060 [Helicobacter sp. 16-1353]|uniref:hypothetical protein n=1 Tax=Helicobacter sp. 16-1353 TaxID=2004996 RepID=UPI000DCC4083|nr:hypothetical protein [Helicobacter sp. 16-1353]RAX54053.1 hypothetical protein CCY99_05060 [Helicobacter sp. 16-1353]